MPNNFHVGYTRASTVNITFKTVILVMLEYEIKCSLESNVHRKDPVKLYDKVSRAIVSG